MTVFACDLSKLTSEQQKSTLRKTMEFFKSATEIVELSMGYQIKFLEQENLIFKIADLLELNRLCCPMIQQTMIVEAHSGQAYIEFTGALGVKEFIAMDLIKLVSPSLAFKAKLINNL